MANLRTNNLSGDGGRNAYRGSVFFDGRDDVTFMQVIAAASNDDFTFGTGDFTIEMWIQHGATGSYDLLYDGRRDGSTDVAPMIYLVSGVVYYYTAGSNRITGSSTLSHNSWHHIAIARQSGSTKLYVNGIQEGSTYSDSNSYVAKLNRPIIGGEGPNPGNNPFGGYISNLRVCKGHAVYTANFEPPTSELEVHYLTDDDKTVLLCCQDSDDALQEATGKELLGQGGLYRGKRFSNLATNGDLETGDTTNWANGGCDTFEISNFSHSGSYSIHAVSNSNGDAIVYTIPVTLDTTKRYKISAYINCVGPGGTTARAKMKIGSGTGGNENYESRTAGASYSGLGNWTYVEWIGLATSDTTHVTFNESSSNNVNDYYVDDLKIELWYPEEGVNILANPNFYSTATGWSFSSTPSGEFSIGSNKLSVADNSRTNDAIASQTLFASSIAEGRYKVTIDYSISSGDFDLGIGNNRHFGVANTYNGGAGNTSSFTDFINAGDGNNSFRIVANQHNVGDFFNVTLSRVAEPKPPKVLPPFGVDAGNTFGGAISMNSSAWMYFPTGRTAERGRGRGINAGSSVPSTIKTIDYFQIQSTGNSIVFGDLTVAGQHTGCSSSTRGVFAMGNLNNTIDFITIATTGNAINFGDRTIAKNGPGGLSNQTRGIFMGGGNPNPQFDTIDYITIASTGDAIDFGNMTSANKNPAGLASPTRGCFAHGGDPFTATIDYITIATTGNAQDFGDTTNTAEGYLACASNTRGIIVGGYVSPSGNVNTIQYVTIATTGNAVDFGDIGSNRVTAQSGAGTSNNLRGVTMGGFNNPNQFSTTMEYVNIATTSNSFDFGYLTSSRAYTAACSDSHGGLS